MHMRPIIDLVSPWSEVPSRPPHDSYILAWAPKQGLLLDIGCGARKVSPRFVGVDCLPKGSPVPGTPGLLSVADVTADALSLPYGDGLVDFVSSCHVLEHIANPVDALREWARVLKSGGHMVTLVPDYRYTFSCKQADQIQSLHGHRWDFTIPELARVLLEIKTVEIVDVRIVCASYSIGATARKL